MLLNMLLFVVLIICVITDLRERKIYNKVIFPSLLLAVLLNGFSYGTSGLITSLLGLLCGLGLLLIPYLMGGMGAGDVKLLALIGAIKGASFVLVTAFYMALIGGVIGIVIILFQKGFFQRLKNFFISLRGIRYGLTLSPLIEKGTLRKTYPYGVAIAGGATFALFMNGVFLL